jgi:molecular chaperone DnaK
MSDPIVGIDLGTSNTVVAYSDATGNVRVLADEAGYKIHPSVVSFHPSGGVVVGAPAKQRKVIDPKNTIFSIKRLIGRSYNSPEVQIAKKRMPYQIKEGPNQLPKVVTRGGEFAIPEISAIVLDHVRNVAAAQLQTQVNRAVVTVPASFNDAQRSATATAGAIAGLTVVRVLNEPTAAALAYGNARNLREVIAVYDFGGGTFDITILKLHDQIYEVLGTGGDTFLGGDDLDERLVDRMVEKFLTEQRIDLRTNEVSMMRLRAVAEQTKIELSRRSRAVVRVDEIAYGASGKPLDLQIEITRDEFVRQVADIIDRTFPVVQEAMTLAGLDPDRIDDVVLVGGTTKIPYVRDQVSKFFSKAPRTDINPEDAVAIGAALQATALERILKRKSPSRSPTVEGSMDSAHTDTTVTAPADTFAESSVVIPDDEINPADVLTLTHEPTSDGSRKARQTSGYTHGGRPRSPSLDPKMTERSVARGEQVDRLEERTPIPGAPPTLPAHSQALGRITKPQGSNPLPGPKTSIGIAAQDPPRETRSTGKPPPSPSGVPRATTQPSPPVQRPPVPPVPAMPPTPHVPAAAPQARTLMIDPSPAVTAPGFSPGPAPGDSDPDFTNLTTERGLTMTTERGLGLGLDASDPDTGQTLPRAFQPQSFPITGGDFPAAVSRSPVVMDVTPRGLGIGTVAGYCEELIRRNSRVPAEIRKLFTTSRDQQDMVRILVCQGESRRLDNNVVIGDLLLVDLPPRPRGETSIEVTFTLDASGILQVHARDALTGKEQRASIEVIGNVTDEDVAASRERVQALRR